ncbi:hypothetical protein [Carboxylicivirga caseinilyticus]|uniref:hypothetical protein n=1 Tax=Carboxylicivirga caseinilyticus TaxID=3417572 RepID=UPI003D33F2D3|nr:hypothetical protein [Marinilabiliaceae bacterium A049]
MELRTEGRKYLDYFVNAFFDIKPGEVKKVFMMQLNIFITVTTLLMIKPVANALFLANVGVEKLPYSFVLVAIAALLLSKLYSSTIVRKSFIKVINRTFIVSALILILISVFLSFDFLETWILYLFYIGVAIFGLITTSQFWILSNLVFNARQAKRLFGIVGAGAIAGGIFGGYLTTILTPIISAENMLYLSAIILLFNVRLNSKIWHLFIEKLNVYQQHKRIELEGKHPLQIIRQSKHLTYLAIIVGLGVVVSKLVDYQFSALASDYYTEPDQLAAFFGFWFSNFNLISLVIQLFITRRVVGTFGVGTSLFILPSFLLFSISLFFIFPVLAVAVLLKMFDVSIKQSINKAATELLALPIPSGIKTQTKSFIDIFVDTAATGISGLLLIFVIQGLDLSLIAVSLLICVIVVIWIYVAKKVRFEYLLAFKQKLIKTNKKITKLDIDFSKKSVVAGLQKVLEHGDEQQKLFVLRKVDELKDIRFSKQVIDLLDSDNDEVRIAAMRCLYFMPMIFNESTLFRFLKDDNIDIRLLTFDILLRYSTEGRVEFIQRYLQNEDPLISNTALVALATESRDNAEMKRLFQINNLIQDKIDYLKLIKDNKECELYKIMILRSIGAGNLSQYYTFIISCLHDEKDIVIVKEAIKSAGNTINDYFIPILLSFLQNSAYSHVSALALANYGPAILSDLQKVCENSTVSLKEKELILIVVENINSVSSVRFLMNLLIDPYLHKVSLNSLNKLRLNYPHLMVNQKTVVNLVSDQTQLLQEILTVLYLQQKESNTKQTEQNKIDELRIRLIGLLENMLDDTLEHIFKLLGLHYPPNDIYTIYNGIQSKNKEQRYLAIEYLEGTLNNNLKRVLLPLLEMAVLENYTDQIVKSLSLNKLTEYECYDMILSRFDGEIIQILRQIISLSEDDSYQSLLTKYNLK